MTTSNHLYWQTARAVCTPKELVALELRDRDEMGTRAISYKLEISRAAVRERLDSADRKIRAAMQNPTQEATA